MLRPSYSLWLDFCVSLLGSVWFPKGDAAYLKISNWPCKLMLFIVWLLVGFSDVAKDYKESAKISLYGRRSISLLMVFQLRIYSVICSSFFHQLKVFKSKASCIMSPKKLQKIPQCLIQQGIVMKTSQTFQLYLQNFWLL